MARAIDKQTMLDLIIEAKRMDPETGSFSEWLAEYLAEHLPALTPPNEWISMEDRTPEFPGFLDHIMVITCDKNDHVIPMVRERTLVGYEWTERWLFPWNEIYDGPEITYWMPLPEPPKGSEDVAENATTAERCAWHEWIKERFGDVR